MEYTQVKQDKYNENLNNVWRVCRKIQAAAFRINIDIRDCFEPDLTEKQGFISESKFVSALERLKDIVGLSDNEIKEVTDYFRIQDGRIACDQFCKVVIEEKLSQTNKGPSNATAAKFFEVDENVHPVFSNKEISLEFNAIISRIKKYVFENRIEIHNFFKEFDRHCSGYISSNQFIRALDAIGVSRLSRLYLTVDQLNVLVEHYACSTNIDKVNWRQFEDLPDKKVFHEREYVSSKPYRVISCPIENPSMVMQKYSNAGETDLLERARFQVQAKIKKRRLHLQEGFRDCDRLNHGRVSCRQFRQVLKANGIILSKPEMNALEDNYRSDDTIDYVKFLREVDPQDYTLQQEPLEAKHLTRTMKPIGIDNNLEEQIVLVMAKVKRQVVDKKVRLMDILKYYDRHNKMSIKEDQFRLALSDANINLEPEEMDLLCSIFKLPSSEKMIEYRRFCDSVEEAFVQKNLERAPLILPLQHLPSTDNRGIFLNDDEKSLLPIALNKLTKLHEYQVSSIKIDFADHDKNKTGRVSHYDFMSVLGKADLLNLLSSHETKSIFDNFSVQMGKNRKFDYKAFLKFLESLKEMSGEVN